MVSIQRNMMSVEVTLSVILFIIVFPCIVMSEDFYERLGISRSASVKEIRKAFKKLAVTMHPDKNPYDEEAHEKFIKINRAYEVLKDEELRKKYDTHGEEGLSSDFQGGRKYESWKFYKEQFGIYDDDPEIITLSKADFEQSVEGTDDVWFINFYSTHCSHCHVLAPTWREMARELEGVIRVGAVNCEDDWHLCRMQGIRSYPSLYMYPSRQNFYGDNSKKELVKFALKYVKVKVHDLWSGNFEKTVTNSGSDRPWLISFCGEGGDCLLPSTGLKIAGMLDELANVGTMDCTNRNNHDVCERLGHSYGTYFYQSKVEKGHDLEIRSLVAQEIASEVLSQLPDVKDLTEEAYQEIKSGLKSGSEPPWLIHFVEGQEGRQLEFRKLHAMLPNLKVGRIDCSVTRGVCLELFVSKFPSFLLFKRTGGYEIYYGRVTAHDVAAFAKDSSFVKLEALSQHDFEIHRVGPDSNELWFVDFFAPWCPPCMKLLPEFRKTARNFGEMVNFGTVDCTIHVHLCQMYKVHSYPTTILYNRTVPLQYHGHHSVHGMGEFIHDTLDPPVVVLDKALFNRHVLQKKSTETWLVDFYTPWCGPCQQIAPEWRQLAKMLKSTKDVYVGMVDCQEHQSLCSQQNVQSYPNLRIYPPNYSRGGFHQFSGWNRDAASLRTWAYDFLPSKVESLTWNEFQNTVLPGTEAWIVDFYSPRCGPCQIFRPEFEKVAEEIEGVAHAGKVDCTVERYLCQQAGIRSYPTVKFYKGTEHSAKSQNMYGWDIVNLSAGEIVKFVKENSSKKSPSGHDEL